MRQRISTTLKTLRQDLAARLGGDFISRLAALAGHTWSDSCILTPGAIIHWFLVQIFHGNTALTHVSLLAGRAFTASAFCQARAGTPVGRLFGRSSARWSRPDSCYRDGGTLARTSRISRGRLGVLHARHPRVASPLRPARNQAKGCGFPVAHMLALFHAGTGLLLEVIAAPLRSHVMAGILGILPLLMAGDVLVADRGFCSFAHLAMLMAKGAMRYFACTRSRSPTSRRAAPMPGRAEAGNKGDAAQPLDLGVRVDGSSGRILQAGAMPQVDERGQNTRRCRSRSWCASCGIGSRRRGSGRAR